MKTKMENLIKEKEEEFNEKKKKFNYEITNREESLKIQHFSSYLLFKLDFNN